MFYFSRVGDWPAPTPLSCDASEASLLPEKKTMPSPMFSLRSEYRGPNRVANNMVGTEGCRAPGNIPRVYGMLNSERATFGNNIPSPLGSSRQPFAGFASPEKASAIVGVSASTYNSLNEEWSRFAPDFGSVPNFREATHAVGLSPLRGDHSTNNMNLDKYKS